MAPRYPRRPDEVRNPSPERTIEAESLEGNEKEEDIIEVRKDSGGQLIHVRVNDRLFLDVMRVDRQDEGIMLYWSINEYYLPDPVGEYVWKGLIK